LYLHNYLHFYMLTCSLYISTIVYASTCHNSCLLTLGIPQCLKQPCYLGLYLGEPEDDSIRVETCSPTPMLKSNTQHLKLSQSCRRSLTCSVSLVTCRMENDPEDKTLRKSNRQEPLTSRHRVTAQDTNIFTEMLNTCHT
jgi:hypothetical protein